MIELRRHPFRALPSANSMQKILFCILVHNDPRQTLRLVRSIYNRNDYFNIHVDQKAAAPYTRLLDALSQLYPNIRVISTFRCGWGGFSLVRASNALLDLGFREHSDWTHAFLLSGAHLPLMPVETIRASLTPGKSCFKWHELGDAVLAPEDHWLKSICDRIEWSFDETVDGKMVKGECLGRPGFSLFRRLPMGDVGARPCGACLDRGRKRHGAKAGAQQCRRRILLSYAAEEFASGATIACGKESTKAFWSAGSWSPKTLSLGSIRIGDAARRLVHAEIRR